MPLFVYEFSVSRDTRNSTEFWAKKRFSLFVVHWNVAMTFNIKARSVCLKIIDHAFTRLLTYTGAQITHARFNESTEGCGGHAVAQLVEALRFKPEGRRVRFPMVSHWNFSLT